MPIAYMLDQLVPHGLSVAYRATSDRQEVLIDITGAGPGDGMMAPVSMATIGDAVAHGAAGGSDFPPTVGVWDVLSGPAIDALGPDDDVHPDALRDAMHWRVELAGVCPLFVRTVVEHLASSFAPNPIKTLSFRGRLPLDDGPLSVREADVSRWLDDPRAYPKAWGQVPFAFGKKSLVRGASLRMKLGQDVDDEIFEAFEMLTVLIPNTVQDFVAASEPVAGVMDVTAQIARGKTELRAKWVAFHYAHDPVVDTVINMLVRFHHAVAPILEVELGLA